MPEEIGHRACLRDCPPEVIVFVCRDDSAGLVDVLRDVVVVARDVEAAATVSSEPGVMLVVLLALQAVDCRVERSFHGVYYDIPNY